MKDIRQKYYVHKAGAKRRNIEFKLTFQEWYDIWQLSSKYNERGRAKVNM